MWTYRVEARRCEPGDEDKLLARGLRRADALEALRTSGLEPGEALRQSLLRSRLSACILVDNEIVALLGVGSAGTMRNRIGVPWIVGHDDFERKETAVNMMRISKRFVECWAKEFGRLGNVVDPEHEKSLRYLERLGFTLAWDRTLFGPRGDKLLYFWR